jgi:hypothetical protein
MRQRLDSPKPHSLVYKAKAAGAIRTTSGSGLSIICHYANELFSLRAQLARKYEKASEFTFSNLDRCKVCGVVQTW